MSQAKQLERVLHEGNPTRAELTRLVVALSVPTILAEVSNTAMEYIDTAMVGSLGATASASVGLVASTTWLLGGLCTGMALGFTVQIAHMVGAGRHAAARNVLRQGIIVLMVFGVLLGLAGAAVSGNLPVWLGAAPEVVPGAASYFLINSLMTPAVQMSRLTVGALQCAGNTRTPSLLNVLMCVLDVVFNFFLIFPTRTASLWGVQVTLPGAGLGVTGAALGTLAAQVIVTALMLWMTCVKSETLGLVGRSRREGAARCTGMPAKSASVAPEHESWRIQGKTMRTAWGIAWPVCLERGVMSAAQIVSTAIVAPLGTVAVAANSLAVTAEGLCYMPGYGVGGAATTLVGQAFGARRKDLARRMANCSVALGMVIMTVTGVAMYFLAPAVFAIFTPDAAVAELGVSVLRIELLAEPLFAASIVAMGALRGAGDTLIPSLMNLATMWGVRITLALLLVPHLGLVGVWVAMCIEICTRGVIFLVRLRHGKWLERTSIAAR